METLIIGKPNVGKSLFLINFAAYLGLKQIRVSMTDSDGLVRRQQIPLDKARRQMVSHTVHKTTAVQTIDLEIAYGKSKRTLSMIDTVGVTDDIHQEASIRRAMAVTLDRMQRAQIILHIVDASAVSAHSIESPGAVDDEIANYASLLVPYVILANKMDKTHAADGLLAIRERFASVPVIAISALTRRGFREVKGFVFRHLA